MRQHVFGGKSRGQMTLSELEAAIGWLERNRLSEHPQMLEGDPRCAWSARGVASGIRRLGATWGDTVTSPGPIGPKGKDLCFALTDLAASPIRRRDSVGGE